MHPCPGIASILLFPLPLASHPLFMFCLGVCECVRVVVRRNKTHDILAKQNVLFYLL